MRERSCIIMCDCISGGVIVYSMLAIECIVDGNETWGVCFWGVVGGYLRLEFFDGKTLVFRFFDAESAEFGFFLQISSFCWVVGIAEK